MRYIEKINSNKDIKRNIVKREDKISFFRDESQKKHSALCNSDWEVSISRNRKFKYRSSPIFPIFNSFTVSSQT